jgi:hypothetical protein
MELLTTSILMTQLAFSTASTTSEILIARSEALGMPVARASEIVAAAGAVWNPGAEVYPMAPARESDFQRPARAALRRRPRTPMPAAARVSITREERLERTRKAVRRGYDPEPLRVERLREVIRSESALDEAIACYRAGRRECAVLRLAEVTADLEDPAAEELRNRLVGP